MRIFVIFSILVSLSYSGWASPQMSLNDLDLNAPQSSFALKDNSNQTSDFVSVDQAFPFEAVQDGNQLHIDWQIKPGYYLYQSKIHIKGQGVTLTPPKLPKSMPHQDEFFGQVMVYANPVLLTVPLSHIQSGATVTIQYQGCAKAGFCFPPKTQTVSLTTVTPPASSSPSLVTDSQNDIAHALSSHKLTLLLMFVFGIGLAFTPCVLPMYPILTGIVLGQTNITRKKAWWLSLSYVQGMALTYTLLGLIVASAGVQFQAALQSPVILIIISLLFIALSLSMFGVYTLQLPNNLQTKLNLLSNHQRGGHSWGVFLMGAISGLVCSPCTTAPLSGALLYVAQTGDLLLGAIALYLLGLGMGVPLIAVAIFGQRVLPKSGAWMNQVKTLFGFVLLAAPIFLLERILPSWWSTMLWSVLGLCAFSWLYKIKNSLPFGGWKQTTLGIVAVLGLIASIKNPVIDIWEYTHADAVPHSELTMIQVQNLDQLQQELTRAKQAHRAVMLDFYADWCVACKEFEKYTFSDHDVQSQLKHFTVLQVNVTDNTPADQAILTHLHVLGLPTIDFWDANGAPLPAQRITGFQKPERFLLHLQNITR